MKRIICLVIAASGLSFWAGSTYERHAWEQTLEAKQEQRLPARVPVARSEQGWMENHWRELFSCREAASKLQTSTLIPFDNADGTANLDAASVEATASPIIWEWMVECSQNYFDLALNNHFALDCPNGNIYIAPVLQHDGTMKAEGSCEGWPS